MRNSLQQREHLNVGQTTHNWTTSGCCLCFPEYLSSLAVHAYRPIDYSDQKMKAQSLLQYLMEQPISRTDWLQLILHMDSMQVFSRTDLQPMSSWHTDLRWDSRPSWHMDFPVCWRLHLTKHPTLPCVTAR